MEWIIVLAIGLLAKRFVLRVDAGQFRLLMDALMLMAGLTMLATALS